LHVESSGNVFNAAYTLIFEQHQPGKIVPAGDAEALLAKLVGWQGQRNLYPVDRPLLFLSKERLQAVESAKPMKGLVSWKQFWGSAEAGSIQGQVKSQGGGLLAKLAAAPDKLTPDDFRLRPDSAGFKAGKDGKDLGADVDLVGPGPAYERWKKTPAYQEWLKETGHLKK